MASGVFDKAMLNLVTKTVSIGANATTTYAILSGATQPTKDTLQTYNEVKQSLGTFEIGAVNGYTVGGAPLTTLAPTTTAGVTAIKVNPSNLTTAWTTTGTLACGYAIIQNCLTASAPTATANPLLCYLYVGAQSVVAGTMTFTWNTNGLMTLTAT